MAGKDTGRRFTNVVVGAAAAAGGTFEFDSHCLLANGCLWLLAEGKYNVTNLRSLRIAISITINTIATVIGCLAGLMWLRLCLQRPLLVEQLFPTVVIDR